MIGLFEDRKPQKYVFSNLKSTGPVDPSGHPACILSKRYDSARGSSLNRASSAKPLTVNDKQSCRVRTARAPSPALVDLLQFCYFF